MTIPSAVWRYRWLVLLLALGFAGLGWLYGTRTEQWTATASMIIQDPRSSTLFDQAFPDVPERYVADQAALMLSRPVAARAVEIGAEQEPPIVLNVEDIEDNLAVQDSSSSNLVSLSYEDITPTLAIGGANAVALAYQEIGSEAAAAGFTSALAELDKEIVEIESGIADLEVIISVRSVPADVRPELLAQLQELEAELLEFQTASSGSTAAQIAARSQLLDLLNLQIESLKATIAREQNVILLTPDPVLDQAIDELDLARVRLTDLQSRRDQLAVDANLAGSGVTFFAPAVKAEPSSVGLYVALGFILGMVIGAVLATVLSRRHQRFEGRSEPASVLDTSLIADVPNFKEERVTSLLPVVDAPTSASAEAFRFVSASISLQQLWPVQDDGAKNFKSVVSLSAGLAEGKSVVTANTAFAAAREGHKVLLIDADFGNQQLTELILGTGPAPTGMTDIVAGNSTLAKAVVDVPQDSAGSLGLLSRGTAAVRAPDFFSAPATAKLFRQITTKYDLVLIDAPPLLRVAYATTLARLADRAMLVVAHGEDVQAAEELRVQMDKVGIPQIGYVYNLAPLRAEMTVSAGSMADTLGEYPSNTNEPTAAE